MNRTLLKARLLYDEMGRSEKRIADFLFSHSEEALPLTITELAEKCAKSGVSVAIDTAGNVPWSSFEAVLPHVSLFLYDVKALDPELHRRGTGADNLLILENLERLLQTGREVIIRTPVIPAYNDGTQLKLIKKYCSDRGLHHELLPYHAIGESKKRAILK
jgi:pyruvate formate lyase activating enzyme